MPRGRKPGATRAKLEGAAKPLSAISAPTTATITAQPPLEPIEQAATPVAGIAATPVDDGLASWFAVVATLPVAQAAPEAEPAAAAPAPLTAADLENPSKVAGDQLRSLAHRLGMSRSEMADMTDERIRHELRYLTRRVYAAESEVA
ncbi:MAG TPA: hypothetical protein VNU71_13510 [Burkholderiaceae bacterium]|nr:hypothetical protein [Burkholderiaceae bacterium]